MTSPVSVKSPATTKPMDFSEAIKEVSLGKKIRSAAWPEGEYGHLKDGRLMIERAGTHQWIITDGDLNAIDWIVVS